MKIIKTSILPTKQHFVNVDAAHEIDKKAICIFAAIGYFLGSDTYWKDRKVLPPASINTVDDNGFWIDSTPWFKWHYTPRDITFEVAVDEFTELFQSICREQTGEQTVLLPLSGGLDSRTQAVAYSKLKNSIVSYSYSFQHGYHEGSIARQIAKVFNYEYHDMTIPTGYLWDEIEALSRLTGCYSEFTHPRQMAMINEFSAMNGVFSLGHWGDVLFDTPTSQDLTMTDAFNWLCQHLPVSGGKELAEALWQDWELSGDFETYFKSRIKEIWDAIEIENVSAKVRAYLSSTRAVRWTNVGFAIFKNANPIKAPYYDDRMAKFICGTPEEFLADRKIQIAYLKNQSPEVAKITWQAQKPYNLYTFTKNKFPYNLPYRVFNKLARIAKAKMGRPFIQRNWELQFLGLENDKRLQQWLFGEELQPFLSKELLVKFYNKFREANKVEYSHPLSILVTLSVWYKEEVRKR